MEISYRKLTVRELDIFIKMRIDQLREEGSKEESDLEPALRDYYTRHMADGTFISWIALDNEEIVGTSEEIKNVAMKELHLSIVSPEKSVFDGDVKIVTLPGTIGSFSILPGHAPIVSSLKAGTLSYTTLDGEEHTLDIQGGFVELSDGTVSACVS